MIQVCTDYLILRSNYWPDNREAALKALKRLRSELVNTEDVAESQEALRTYNLCVASIEKSGTTRLVVTSTDRSSSGYNRPILLQLVGTRAFPMPKIQAYGDHASHAGVSTSSRIFIDTLRKGNSSQKTSNW